MVKNNKLIMENLEFYNKVKEVPQGAQKTIGGGRLKGFTDINPMWRIKTLTENFGLCGIGWKIQILNKWIEMGARGESTANVEIALFVKVDDKWSEGICGIGGSMFVASEKTGLFTSDECFKMALTDAISVACKMLGMGANTYWDKDRTEYDAEPDKQAHAASLEENKNDDLQLAFQEIIECKDIDELTNVYQRWIGYKDDIISKIAIREVQMSNTTEQVTAIWNKYKSLHADKSFVEAVAERGKKLKK